MGIYQAWGVRQYCDICRYKTLPYPLKIDTHRAPVEDWEAHRCSGCGKKYSTLCSEEHRMKRDENQKGMDEW